MEGREALLGITSNHFIPVDQSGEAISNSVVMEFSNTEQAFGYASDIVDQNSYAQ